jgi:isoleucyl-tRNA synthetase
MDWDNSYFTMSDENNYAIWKFLKTVHENGWLYKGADSVPWCPRCETAISQHEMLTEDYKETTHESVYLAFPITGVKEEYLLVWTTTPWTIPANISIAVDENLEYSLVAVGERKYWLATDTKDRVLAGTKYEVVKTTKGSKLAGMKYQGAFDDLPAVKKAANEKFHTVIVTDSLILPITTTEGTGLVHTAVSAGSEDFKLGQKLGLPMIPVINDDATYMDGFGFLSGLNAKENPGLILGYLKKLDAEGKHFFLKIENYKHRYPACWRCKTELVWKVADEWYIAMDKGEPTLRQRMIEVAKKINWLPSFGLDRELDWLTNMHDWLISKKNRYWGLALPIWECKKCGNFEVIGSKEELSERSLKGELKGTPHKPQIDKIKVKCSKCGEEVSRIEPVGNPWLDAGIVSLSTLPDDWFPADLITESFPGQFKNWFYSLIAMATVMKDSNPTKTILGFATLMGEDGRPMHKSWGNSIEFNEGADKIGVDVMRWMYARQNPADNLLFGYGVADEVRRRFHLKLWNIYNFFVTYANLDGWKPNRSQLTLAKSSIILDKWIMARLNQTIEIVTKSLDKFDAYSASGEIDKFVDDLSLWYVRRSRDRIGPASESEKDKNAFYKTTYYVLYNTSKLLAPFTPFLSELIFRNLTKGESVHLSDWPKLVNISEADEVLIAAMDELRDVVEVAHSIRKEHKIPVRQPLNSYSSKSKLTQKNIEYLLKEEINVRSVVWGANTDKYDLKITKELEEEMMVRDLVRSIQEKRKEMGLSLTQKVDVTNDFLPGDQKLAQWLVKKAQIGNLSKGKFNVRLSSKG